jgi:hypothetical protein
MSGLLTHALLAWFITAGPLCVLLMIALTFLLSRIARLAPAIAPAESGD